MMKNINVFYKVRWSFMPPKHITPRVIVHCKCKLQVFSLYLPRQIWGSQLHKSKISAPQALYICKSGWQPIPLLSFLSGPEACHILSRRFVFLHQLLSFTRNKVPSSCHLVRSRWFESLTWRVIILVYIHKVLFDNHLLSIFLNPYSSIVCNILHTYMTINCKHQHWPTRNGISNTKSTIIKPFEPIKPLGPWPIFPKLDGKVRRPHGSLRFLHSKKKCGNLPKNCVGVDWSKNPVMFCKTFKKNITQDPKQNKAPKNYYSTSLPKPCLCIHSWHPLSEWIIALGTMGAEGRLGSSQNAAPNLKTLQFLHCPKQQ